MKKLLFRMPENVQRKINWRLRRLKEIRTYNGMKRQLNCFSEMDVEQQKQWIFKRVHAAAVLAQQENPFYRHLYSESGVDLKKITSFEDLKKIPIVTKEMLRHAENKWRQPIAGCHLGNTGGTSGSPLKFCLTRSMGVREHFYMDTIWKRIGCTRKHTRAVFRGLNLGSRPWIYVPGSDAYFINSYRPLSETAPYLESFFATHKVEYLHGYPSLIYFFSKELLNNRYQNLRENILRYLKGILLSSEYPAPQYREIIEKIFPVPTISWYGHSEVVILAAENKPKFIYEPFQSYGFCEAVASKDGTIHLVGTAYDNPYSPFIRYDTGDSIMPVYTENGLLRSFRIHHGRLGEFVKDRKGHSISLTAFIFGRHHEAFGQADFIQVSQKCPGQVKLHVTTRHNVLPEQILQWFDLSNIDMEFDIERRKQPVYAPSGKVPLLIQNKDLELQ